MIAALAFLAIFFIMWEFYMMTSKRLMNLYLSRAKRKSYYKWENWIMNIYTIYLILGVIFIDFSLFLAIFILAILKDLVNNSKLQTYTKIKLFQLDNLLTMVILGLVIRYHYIL